MTQCITARKGVLTYRGQSRRKPYLLQAADILEGTRTDRLYTVKTQISQLGSSKGTRTDRLQMRQVDSLKTATAAESRLTYRGQTRLQSEVDISKFATALEGILLYLRQT